MDWKIVNSMGFHAVAVGVDAPININIRGSVGYYCAGMKKAGYDHRARFSRSWVLLIVTTLGRRARKTGDAKR